MRRQLAALFVLAASVLGVGLTGIAPASAMEGPVRAGYDNCGNFQVWVNGNATIQYFVCNPPS